MTTDFGAPPPRIVAFDLALTASGVVLPDGHADTLKPPPKLKGGARLDWWLDSFNVILADHQPNRIIIETPFAGHGALQLSKIYGCLDIAIHRHTPDAVITWVPPSRLKKLWTGDGRADKDDMRVAAALNHGFNPHIAGLDDNAIDALALWTLATNGELDKEPT